MEINIRKISTDLAEVKIEAGNTTITETVSKSELVDGEAIESAVHFARELANFAGTSDFDFVKNIANMYLNESEQNELAEYLTLNT